MTDTQDETPLTFTGLLLNVLHPLGDAEFLSEVSGVQVRMPFERWVELGRPPELTISCHKP